MTRERLLGRGHSNLWVLQIHPEVFMASEQFPKGPLVVTIETRGFLMRWLSDGHHLVIS